MGLQKGSEEDKSTNNLGDVTNGSGSLDQLVFEQRFSKLKSPLPLKEGMSIEVVGKINQHLLIHTGNLEVVVTLGQACPLKDVRTE